MRRTAGPRSGISLAVGMLAACLAYWAGIRSPGKVRLTFTGPRAGLAPYTPSQAARREALRWRIEAWQGAVRNDDAVEAWDPQAASGKQGQIARGEPLASNSSAALLRARRAAKRAVALARTPDEIYRAVWLLMRIEGDLGLHREELAHARLLVSLQPLNPNSLRALEGAANGNGLTALANQAAARAAVLERMPESRGFEPGSARTESAGSRSGRAQPAKAGLVSTDPDFNPGAGGQQRKPG